LINASGIEALTLTPKKKDRKKNEYEINNHFNISRINSNQHYGNACGEATQDEDDHRYSGLDYSPGHGADIDRHPRFL
jgi:hypothetical protein